jgi:hypothetical protein
MSNFSEFEYGDYIGVIDQDALDAARRELAHNRIGEMLHCLTIALGREFIELEDRVRRWAASSEARARTTLGVADGIAPVRRLRR